MRNNEYDVFSREWGVGLNLLSTGDRWMDGPTECLMRKLMISDTTLDSVKLDATPLPCHVKLDINGVFLSWWVAQEMINNVFELEQSAGVFFFPFFRRWWKEIVIKTGKWGVLDIVKCIKKKTGTRTYLLAKIVTGSMMPSMCSAGCTYSWFLSNSLMLDA